MGGEKVIRFDLDQDWRFRSANDHMLEVFERDWAEIAGHSFLGLYPQVCDSPLHKALLIVSSDGTPQDFEAISPVLRRRVHYRVSPIEDGGVSVQFRILDPES
ncbi:PAS domain-containing protein [Telmatospirillum sp. J64-1]|uniref:PAS domain-containing protein n=1 Tax=Telmatospirillum sp. J64-1 TaxID=2502183 RepID=UPI00115E66BD|nr:PAS domain-containing protein [Telmatospirillum sp. J64-1]